MSFADEIRNHLPFLRRYARALTGNQQQGDTFVHTMLEVIVAAPDEFGEGYSTRIDLYRTFHRIWETSYIDGGQVDSDDPAIHAAQKQLARITPLGRQVFLLTALEGFTTAEAALITGTNIVTVDTLLAEAVANLEHEAHTKVLIIEDELLIGMELESIVRSLGHEVAAIAATHRDALAAVEKHRPGLILADIQLADGSSGIEAVQDIMDSSPVPVVFITAFPERLLTGDRAEPAFLISKPFRDTMVRAAISQSLIASPQPLAA